MSAFLERGFRPFFLLAAIQAVAGAGVWLLLLSGTWLPGSATASWHGREMVFGFATAVIAGFLLTAVQNWTGRVPVNPRGLAGLVTLWLVGRLVTWLPATTGAGWSALVDGLFLVALATVLARAIISGRNWRNLLIPSFPLVLAGLQVASWRDAWFPSALGLELGILVLVLLMAFMGGRVIPFFTERRLPAAGVIRTPRLDRVILVLLLALLPAWGVGKGDLLATLLLVTAGSLLLVRQIVWRPHKTLGEPLLWVLHAGHAWLGTGLVLLGGATWFPTWGTVDASHALTIGALGSLTLGMMARVALGHTGRALHVDSWITTAFALVSVAAILRLAGGFWPAWMPLLLAGAAACWGAAFIIYLVRFGPVLVAPRVDEPTGVRIR